MRLGHRCNSRTMAASPNCHHWLRWHIVDKSSALDGEAVQLHQSLTHLRIRGWINLTTLGIAKEVIQNVKSPFPRVVRGMVTQVCCMLVDRIVHGTIALWLLGLIVAVMAAVVVRLPIVSVCLVHLGVGMIIITRGASCKIPQVSNYLYKGASD